MGKAESRAPHTVQELDYKIGTQEGADIETACALF